MQKVYIMSDLVWFSKKVTIVTACDWIVFTCTAAIICLLQDVRTASTGSYRHHKLGYAGLRIMETSPPGSHCSQVCLKRYY